VRPRLVRASPLQVVPSRELRSGGVWSSSLLHRLPWWMGHSPVAPGGKSPKPGARPGTKSWALVLNEAAWQKRGPLQGNRTKQYSAFFFAGGPVALIELSFCIQKRHHTWRNGRTPFLGFRTFLCGRWRWDRGSVSSADRAPLALRMCRPSPPK